MLAMSSGIPAPAPDLRSGFAGMTINFTGKRRNGNFQAGLMICGGFFVMEVGTIIVKAPSPLNELHQKKERPK